MILMRSNVFHWHDSALILLPFPKSTRQSDVMVSIRNPICPIACPHPHRNQIPLAFVNKTIGTGFWMTSASLKSRRNRTYLWKSLSLNMWVYLACIPNVPLTNFPIVSQITPSTQWEETRHEGKRQKTNAVDFSWRRRGGRVVWNAATQNSARLIATGIMFI